jgi:hypothetical protein
MQRYLDLEAFFILCSFINPFSDIDECSEGDKCTKQNEQCLNTDGAYKCECADGFKRNGQDDCELDVEGKIKIKTHFILKFGYFKFDFSQ